MAVTFDCNRNLDFLKLPISPNSAFEPVTPSRPRCDSTSTSDFVVDFLVDDCAEETDYDHHSCNDGFVKRQIERWEELFRRESLSTDDTLSCEDTQVETECNIPAPIVTPPLLLHGSLSLQYLSPLDDKFAILLYALIQVKADFQMTELRLQHGKWQYDNSKAGQRPRGRRNPGAARSHEDVSLPRIPEHVAESDLRKGVSEQNLSGRLVIKSLTEYRIDLDQRRNASAAHPQGGIPTENRGLQLRSGATSPRYHEATSSTQQMMHQRIHRGQVFRDPHNIPQQVPPSRNRLDMAGPQIPNTRVAPHGGQRLDPNHSRLPVPQVRPPMARSMLLEPHEGQRIGVTHSHLPVSHVRSQIPSGSQPGPHEGQRFGFNHSRLPAPQVKQQLTSNMQPERHEGQRHGLNYSRLPVSHARTGKTSSMQPEPHEGQRIVFDHSGLPIHQGRPKATSRLQPGIFSTDDWMRLRHSSRDKRMTEPPPTINAPSTGPPTIPRIAISRPKRDMNSRPKDRDKLIHNLGDFLVDMSDRQPAQENLSTASDVDMTKPEMNLMPQNYLISGKDNAQISGDLAHKISHDPMSPPFIKVERGVQEEQFRTEYHKASRTSSKLVSNLNENPLSRLTSTKMDPPHLGNGNKVETKLSSKPSGDQQATREVRFAPVPCSQAFITDRKDASEFPVNRVSKENMSQRFAEGTQCAPDKSATSPVSEVQNEAGKDTYHTYSHATSRQTGDSEWGIDNGSEVKTILDALKPEFSHSGKGMSEGREWEPKVAVHSSRISEANARSIYLKETDLPSAESEAKHGKLSAVSGAPSLGTNIRHDSNTNEVTVSTTTAQDFPQDMTARVPVEQSPCDRIEMTAIPAPENITQAPEHKNSDALKEITRTLPLHEEVNAENTAEDKCVSVQQMDVRSEVNVPDKHEVSISTSQDGPVAHVTPTESGGDEKEVHTINQVPINDSEKNPTESDHLQATSGTNRAQMPEALLSSDQLNIPTMYEVNHESSETDNGIQMMDVEQASTDESAGSELLNTTIAEPDLDPYVQHTVTHIASSEIHLETSCPTYNTKSCETMAHDGVTADHNGAIKCSNYATIHGDTTEDLSPLDFSSPDQQMSLESLRETTFASPRESGTREKAAAADIQENELKRVISQSVIDPVLTHGDRAQEMFVSTKSTESGNQVPESRNDVAGNEDHSEEKLDNAGDISEEVNVQPPLEDNTEDPSTDTQLSPVEAPLPAPTSQCSLKGTHVSEGLETDQNEQEKLNNERLNDSAAATHDTHLAEDKKVSEAEPHPPRLCKLNAGIFSANIDLRNASEEESLCVIAQNVPQRENETFNNVAPSSSVGDHQTSVHSASDKTDSYESFPVDDIGLKASAIERKIATVSNHVMTTEKSPSHGYPQLSEFPTHGEDSADKIAVEDAKLPQMIAETMTIQKPQDDSRQWAAVNDTVLDPDDENVRADVENDTKELLASDSNWNVLELVIREPKPLQSHVDPTNSNEIVTSITSMSTSLSFPDEGSHVTRGKRNAKLQRSDDENQINDIDPMAAGNSATQCNTNPRAERESERSTSNSNSPPSKKDIRHEALLQQESPMIPGSYDEMTTDDKGVIRSDDEQRQNKCLDTKADEIHLTSEDAIIEHSSSERFPEETQDAFKNGNDGRYPVVPSRVKSKAIKVEHTTEERSIDTHQTQSNANQPPNVSTVFQEVSEAFSVSEHATDEPTALHHSDEFNEGVVYADESMASVDLTLKETGPDIETRSEMVFSLDRCVFSSLTSDSKSQSLSESHQHQLDAGKGDDAMRSPKATMSEEERSESSAELGITPGQVKKNENHIGLEKSRYSSGVDIPVSVTEADHQNNFTKHAESFTSMSSYQESGEKIDNGRTNPTAEKCSGSDLQLTDSVACDGEAVPHLNSQTLSCKNESQNIKHESKELSANHTAPVKGNDLSKRYLHALKVDIGKTGKKTLRSFDFKFAKESRREIKDVEEKDKAQINSELQHPNLQIDRLLKDPKADTGSFKDFLNAKGHDYDKISSGNTEIVSRTPPLTTDGENNENATVTDDVSSGKTENIGKDNSSNVDRCDDMTKSYKVSSGNTEIVTCIPLLTTDDQSNENFSVADGVSSENSEKTLDSFDFTFAGESRKESEVMEGEERHPNDFEFQNSNLHCDMEKLLKDQKADRDSFGDSSNADGCDVRTHPDKTWGNTEIVSCTVMTGDENNEIVNVTHNNYCGNNEKTLESFGHTFAEESRKESKVVESKDKQQMISEFQHPKLYLDMDKPLKDKKADRGSLEDSSNANGHDSDKISSGNAEIVSCTPPVTTEDGNNENANVTESIPSENTENTDSDHSSNVDKDDGKTHSYKISDENTLNGSCSLPLTTDDENTDRSNMIDNGYSRNTERTNVNGLSSIDGNDALADKVSSGNSTNSDCAPLLEADGDDEIHRVINDPDVTQPAKIHNDAVLSFRSKANYTTELRKLSREIQAFRSELTEGRDAPSHEESFQIPSSDDSEFLALEAMCMNEDSTENRLSLIIDEDIINNLHINEDDVKPTSRGRRYSSESVSSEFGVSRKSRIPVPVTKISRSHSCLADIERDDSKYGEYLGRQPRKQRSIARIVPIPRNGSRSMPSTPTLSRRSKIPVRSHVNSTPISEIKKQSDRGNTRSSKKVRPRGPLWSYSSTPDLASDDYDRYGDFRREKARPPVTPTGTPRWNSLRKENKQPKPFKSRECAIVPLPEWERLKKVLDSAEASRASTCPSTPSEICFLSRASSQESWDFPTMSEGYHTPRSPGYATPRSVSAVTSPRPSRWRVDGKVPRHLKKKYAWEPSESALTTYFDGKSKSFQNIALEHDNKSSTTPVKSSVVTPSSSNLRASDRTQRTPSREADSFNSSSQLPPEDDAPDPAPRGAENISPTSGLKSGLRVGFALEQFSSDTDSEPERLVRSDPNLAAKTKGSSWKRRLSLRRKKAPEKSRRDDEPDKPGKKKKRKFDFLKWLGLRK